MQRTAIIHLVIFTLVLCVADSCTVERRHYRNGYYIASHNYKSSSVAEKVDRENTIELADASPLATRIDGQSINNEFELVSAPDTFLYRYESACAELPRDTSSKAEADSAKCVRRIKVSSGGLAVVSALIAISTVPVPVWIIPPILLIIAMILTLRLRRALKTYRETTQAATRKQTSSLHLALAIASLVLGILAWVFVLALDLPAIALGFAVFSLGAAVIGFLTSLSRIRAYRPTKEHKAVEGAALSAMAISFVMGMLWIIVSAIISFFVGWGIG